MTKPKHSVAQLAPYVNGKHAVELFENPSKILKLDSNEASIAPSPFVVGSLVDFIKSSPLNWYPDIHSEILVKKLSHYTELPRKFIQTYNGSDNALETICKTYLEKGDEVLLCVPTYDHFRVYAESCDATLIPVVGASPFYSKKDKLIEALTPATKLIYIVNPNNPTGMMYSEEEVRDILTAAPHALLIVDEAYFEFCGKTMAPLVQEFKNLIVTRSFSKAFGLAGLRVGYLLTDPQNHQHLNKIRVGKNINTLGQVAASAALDDIQFMHGYVEEVKTAKKWLLEKLATRGVKCVDTPANFILMQLAQPAKVLLLLEQQNIFIRDRSFLNQLSKQVRITIGHQHLMERFYKAFSKIPSSLLFEKETQKATGS